MRLKSYVTYHDAHGMCQRERETERQRECVKWYMGHEHGYPEFTMRSLESIIRKRNKQM
jgi:hypothetical protein